MDHGKDSEVTAAFDQIDELARWLFQLSDPPGIWAAQDHGTQLWYRGEAARRLDRKLLQFP